MLLYGLLSNTLCLESLVAERSEDTELSYAPENVLYVQVALTCVK